MVVASHTLLFLDLIAKPSYSDTTHYRVMQVNTFTSQQTYLRVLCQQVGINMCP